MPSTERVETVSGVGTPREPPRAPLRHLWITNLCAAPSRVPAQLQSKDFDARRRLESRCLGIPCAPRKCIRVFFRALVGYQPQLLNRAHDAALGQQSLSSPQPNKSRLNTSGGFFTLRSAASPGGVLPPQRQSPVMAERLRRQVPAGPANMVASRRIEIG